MTAKQLSRLQPFGSNGRLQMGETPGTREAIGRMTESLKKEGMPADKAKKIATDAAKRADRRANDKR